MLYAPLGETNAHASTAIKEGRGFWSRPFARLACWSYLSRSLALPSLSLAVPFVWSERPSDFLASSPVKAPVASLALPFALSKAPSPLSWVLLFLPMCSFSLLRASRARSCLPVREPAQKGGPRDARGWVASNC